LLVFSFFGSCSKRPLKRSNAARGFGISDMSFLK
jgi:hypothetical protein